MAKLQPKIGFLTKSMKNFLKMSEKKRFEKYGYDVNSMYKRILDRLENSFWDIIEVYDNLPEKRREKINLARHYQTVVEHLARKNISQNVPVISLVDTSAQVKEVVEKYLKNDEELKNLANPSFSQVISWLEFLDKNKTYSSWRPDI